MFIYFENGKEVKMDYKKSEVIDKDHYRVYLENGKILDFKNVDIGEILRCLRNKGFYNAQFDINAGKATLRDCDIVFILEEACRILQNQEDRLSERCF